MFRDSKDERIQLKREKKVSQTDVWNMTEMLYQTRRFPNWIRNHIHQDFVDDGNNDDDDEKFDVVGDASLKIQWMMMHATNEFCRCPKLRTNWLCAQEAKENPSSILLRFFGGKQLIIDWQLYGNAWAVWATGHISMPNDDRWEDVCS